MLNHLLSHCENESAPFAHDAQECRYQAQSELIVNNGFQHIDKAEHIELDCWRPAWTTLPVAALAELNKVPEPPTVHLASYPLA